MGRLPASDRVLSLTSGTCRPGGVHQQSFSADIIGQDVAPADGLAIAQADGRCGIVMLSLQSVWRSRSEGLRLR